jgi:hypothetical protein
LDKPFLSRSIRSYNKEAFAAILFDTFIYRGVLTAAVFSFITEKPDNKKNNEKAEICTMSFRKGIQIFSEPIQTDRDD